MKCGFVRMVGGISDKPVLFDEIKDHNGVVQHGALQRGVNGTITIDDVATFRFEGQRTSILRFLLDYSLRMFESTTQHLFIKSGKEMEVDVAKVLLETVPKAIMGAVHAPAGEELWEAGFKVKEGIETAYEHARGGVNRAAAQREDVKPGRLYTWIDHRINKRMIIDLQARAPLNDSSWKQLEKRITFANLAGFIRDEF